MGTMRKHRSVTIGLSLILAACATVQAPPSTAEILEWPAGRPVIIRLLLGPVHVLVSVERSLLRLRHMAGKHGRIAMLGDRW